MMDIDISQGQNRRYCKKCLMRDLKGDEEYYADLSSAIAAILPEHRTPEDEYNRRLAICKECEKLMNGMCFACGCYVELRAASLHNSCSYKKW